MHIINIASELAPIAKVGGLGDVLLGLSRELSWKGHDVDIIIPKYDSMDTAQIRDLSIDYMDLQSFYEGQWYSNTVWTGWVENLKVYFIDPHHPRFFFSRGCIYGCEDDTERFLYFCRASLEFIHKKQLNPDVIHLHDWQTAMIAPLFFDMYLKLGIKRSKIVFTIHNIDYQGRCAPSDLDKIGLNGQDYLKPEKLQDTIYPQSINSLKGAIVYADFITTVSPRYAKEVLEPEEGRGLENVLKSRKNDFFGILNGIDYSYWNPEIDRFLPAHFSSREFPANKKDHKTVDRKAYVKKILREKLELEDQHKPIVGCVTRLVPQKGPELIKSALEFTLKNDGQFVMLGSGSIDSLNNEFHALKHQYQDNPNIHLILYHHEEMAHLIYGGSDIFIVPSMFEPCGLTQLIALKYGAVPVVRAIGGLADTIFDVDNSGLPFESTNGYTFLSPTAEGINSTLKRAFDTWFNNPEKWRKLMINGMNIDHSWNYSSDLYLEIYKKPNRKAPSGKKL